nr:uncharacterized protein BN887_00214 [Melanopsichium pennsylvanicum 4]
MTVPYGLRRNTAPCTPMVGYTSREVASTSSTTSSTTNVVPPPFGSNIMAPFHTTSREQRGVGTFYGGQQQQGGMHLPQVIRPTPLRYSSSHLNSISSFVVGMGEERRDSTATEASFTSSFAYGPPLQHMQFQIQPGNRPWTTGSSLPLALAHSMNEHDSTSNTPSFRFNSMLNESSDPSSALSRAQNSSSTSTLNSIWTDTNVEASSLTTAQRPVRPPPPSPPPPLFDVPRPRTFFNEQEEILRECTPGGATQSSHNELRAGLGADHGETASQELRQW